NLGDATLMPGMIDSHVHLSDEFEDNWYKGFYQDLTRVPAEQALYASHYAQETLDAGFTSVRDLGSTYYIASALRNAIDAGVIEGPDDRLQLRDRFHWGPRGQRPAAAERGQALRARARRMQRPRRMPRCRALSDEVRRHGHQVHALGRRAVPDRPGGRAGTQPARNGCHHLRGARLAPQG